MRDGRGKRRSDSLVRERERKRGLEERRQRGTMLLVQLQMQHAGISCYLLL